MKALTIPFLIMWSFSLQGRIITVSNMPDSPGQYTSITAAMGAVLPNDTVYVHGSTSSYGTAYFSMNGLVVIGSGHNPDKQFPYTTTFTDIYIYGDNIKLIGITANAVRVQTSNPHFTMRRCKILGAGSFLPGVDIQSVDTKDLLFESNVFTGGEPNIRAFESLNDVITIRNNVFSNSLDLGGSGQPSQLLIANNIFLKGPQAFTNINYATISNNIFYGSSPFVPAASTIGLFNNISYQCPVDFFTTGSNITLSDNLEGVDPQFVSYPGGGASFSDLHDYNLMPGSPAIATGSDGTDRGVYGGFGTIFNMRGEPAIAQLKTVTITSSTTVAPGGTLTVSITSKRIH